MQAEAVEEFRLDPTSVKVQRKKIGLPAEEDLVGPFSVVADVEAVPLTSPNISMYGQMASWRRKFDGMFERFPVVSCRIVRIIITSPVCVQHKQFGRLIRGMADAVDKAKDLVSPRSFYVCFDVWVCVCVCVCFFLFLFVI